MIDKYTHVCEMEYSRSHTPWAVKITNSCQRKFKESAEGGRCNIQLFHEEEAKLVQIII